MLIREATKYMARDQAQVLSVIKLTEASEVTLTTHQAQPFSKA